jgi:hypothetical protein
MGRYKKLTCDQHTIDASVAYESIEVTFVTFQLLKIYRHFQALSSLLNQRLPLFD